MIALMVFAAVVAVTQLTVLASWSRTLRLGTLLQGVALGFLVCAPLTAVVQWLVTRGVALVSRQSIGDVVPRGWLAWPLDRRTLARARAARPELLLAGEAPSGLDPRPMLAAAFRRAPWSTWSTWQVVLERRAALLNWRAILWLAAMLPGVAFLIVGGFPATQALQRWMTGWVGAGLAAAGVLAGAVLVVAQFPRWIRGLRSVTEPALHETRLRPAVRLATASGGLLAGAAMILLLVFTRDPGHRIVTNFHVLDALSNATLMLGLAILLLSFMMFPPAAALLVTTTGTVVVTGSGIALITGTLIGTSLITQGLLQMASGEGSSSSGSGSSNNGSSRPPRTNQSDWEKSSVESGRFNEADLPRLRDLSKDPAHGGKTTEGTWGEAEVGLGLEKNGSVRGLTRSNHPGEEFVDRARQGWDVKAFRSENFDLAKSMANMGKKIRGGINIMMDTRGLSAEQFVQLEEAVQKAGWAGKVLWWP